MLHNKLGIFIRIIYNKRDEQFMDKIRIDTLLTNGVIYTLREEGHTVEVIGIHKGVIIFAGSNRDSKNYIASETINLDGKTVIPGMGDSHLHMYAYCQNHTSVKLDDMKSIEELILIMKEKTMTTEKGTLKMKCFLC